MARQREILRRLRVHYTLSHDGIPTGIMSGIDPLPKDWVEAQLAAMGDTWRRPVY